jgi:hypothetical protein
MKILSAKICGLSILAMTFTFAASAQNLLVNGGFDAPSSIGPLNLSYDTESYWFFSQNDLVNPGENVPNPSLLLGGNWTYAKGSSDFDALVTNSNISSAGYFVTLGGGGNAAGGSIVQSFNAEANSTYTASLDVGYIGARVGSVGIRFSILDAASSNQSVSYLDVSSLNNLPTTPWTFATYSFQFTAPSTNLAFKVEDITASSSDTDLIFNNASVVAVPEPSTYTLLATGLLIVCWTFLRRRRTSCSSSH